MFLIQNSLQDGEYDDEENMKKKKKKKKKAPQKTAVEPVDCTSPESVCTVSIVYISLFQALGLWGKSEKAGERGKDERGRRRAKEREPVRISLTALCRYSRSCYTL